MVSRQTKNTATKTSEHEARSKKTKKKQEKGRLGLPLTSATRARQRTLQFLCLMCFAENRNHLRILPRVVQKSRPENL